ncbi:MAG: hypothetical protein CNLJKLNK_01236 [Holosporales bacterium]
MESLKKVIGPVMAFFVTIYFGYHIFQGERGVMSWIHLNKKVKDQEKILNDLILEKEAIERRVSLLKPENLDRDLLEEMAKKLLSYVGKNETVITKKNENVQHIATEKGTHS